MPPPAQERWAILAGIPKALPIEEAKDVYPQDTGISVACNEPPCASVLTVPYCVSAGAADLWYPYIAAADPSGLLLLAATHPACRFSCATTYYLCDAPTGKAVSLPNHLRPMGVHGHNAGLIRSGGDFMVAELLPTRDGSGRAALLCFNAGRYGWVEKELTYSPPLHDWKWRCEGVVAHGGMLWWVDLSYGLLACDPFTASELLHVPLPRVLDELPVNLANRAVYRCVKVSGGRLRFVQIHGNPDAPVVTMWALADPACAGEWNQERRVPLAEVWADQSYRDTMLPQSIPALALLHPMDPDKVYFFLGSSIFAVNLMQKKVVEFNEFAMPDPPRHLKRSSHFVHAWQYDLSGRPDFLPKCFKLDKITLKPEFKKYFKKYQDRCKAADSRLTMVTPVVQKKVCPDKYLKTFRDFEKMEMEYKQAKKMKLAALLLVGKEYEKKKNLRASSSINEE